MKKGRIRMKKPTFIIGKKHIILACLTLILGIAIYVNYVFATPNSDDIVADPTIAASDMAQAESNSDSDKADPDVKQQNYGDTAFVMAETYNVPTGADTVNPASGTDGTDGTDYFSQARLARMVSRDAAAEQLSAIIGGGDTSEEENTTYTMAAVDLSALGEKETMIESLIKAQGFSDCVVYLSDDTANIVVKSEGLLPAEAAQIKDILLGEVTVPAENIRIFEVK
jgi:stage III sporulation protein AH